MRHLIILIASLFIASTVHAGTISVPALSADSGLPHLNTFLTTVVDEINGELEGSAEGSTVNIKADSIGELDMGDNINPRLRTNELLDVGADTVSSQNAYVDTGLTPATSTDLTSDISAGTAYVNGYRVTKTATSKTYTASKDTYVDIDQDGTFTYSEVANGATEPAVATNSARLAKVVTDGDNITSVTDMANRTLPGLFIPTNFRDGLKVSWGSATTMTVAPGKAEVNGTLLTKTSNTTLTLTTAGNWAGGSSLQAVSTHGYVGIDASGNLKMHTTAPTHQNYAVSVTAGKKRYATWSSTVYRILGWFYMNATGSGQLDRYGVGNIKEADVPNSVVRTSTTSNSVDDTAFASDMTETQVNFYSSGGPVRAELQSSWGGAAVNGKQVISFDASDTLTVASETFCMGDGTSYGAAGSCVSIHQTADDSQGAHTILGRALVASGTAVVDKKTMTVTEY